MFDKNFFVIIVILSIAVILYLMKRIKIQEILLNQKDMFVKHSVHEIKTPLSIISLNNQLRQRQFGEDYYSNQIESAIKILTTSYEDMTYLLMHKKVQYAPKQINLSYFMSQRIEYFQDIALSYERSIELTKKGNFIVCMSEVELTRVIDNNLSNAIKYSNINSNIEVAISDNVIVFKTYGNKIEDTQKIFSKYERECAYNAGLGLGLSIVKDICKQHQIIIDVQSNDKFNIFSYTFSA